MAAAGAGVRVPDQGFAREVCRRAGGALALTSANLSGATSPLQVFTIVMKLRTSLRDCSQLRRHEAAQSRMMPGPVGHHH